MGLVSLRVAAQRDSMSLSEPRAASRRVLVPFEQY